MLSLNIGLSIFFEPILYGVACPMGSEKVIHRIKAYEDKHLNDIDFSVLMQGGFQECIQFSLHAEMLFYWNAQSIFKICFLGWHGVMALTLFCGTLLAS